MGPYDKIATCKKQANISHLPVFIVKIPPLNFCCDRCRDGDLPPADEATEAFNFVADDLLDFLIAFVRVRVLLVRGGYEVIVGRPD